MAQCEDDRSLWVRVRSGDEAAFSVLYDRYVDVLYNFLFRRTGSWDASEDMVGTVFLEAWRQRGHVELVEDSLRPWLFGVAVNLTKRYWRDLDRKRRAHSKLQSDPHWGGDHAADVAARIDAERAIARTLRTLESLPERQREVVRLWAWEGLSYEAISHVLRIPVGTVRSRLHRARIRLEQNFGTSRPLRESTSNRSSQSRR